MDKHIYYKYAIIELEKVLYESPAYSSFSEMIEKIFFRRHLGNLYILLVYKILKEFDEMLDSKNFNDMLMKKRTNISSGEIYWGLLRKKFSRKERKIIDETEHFGQNDMFNHYKSIEENLSRLNVKIDVDS
ncbi:hypothetical protein [Flavobacterium sp. CFS9]